MAELTHAIELHTLDGLTINLDGSASQTLLDTAARAEWRLPAQCRQGSCGACHARVLSGDYAMAEHDPAALPDDLAQHGHVLLCCTTPRSDLRVQLPYTQDRIQRDEPKVQQAEIVELTRDGDHAMRLVLALLPDADGAAVASFEPGQFMTLEVPGPGPGPGLRRTYSLANTGNWDGRLEFLIALRPQGRFSTWLERQARCGDRLVVHGPQGAFGLQENGLRPRWFVAGGTGLAPLLSMLRRMAEFQEPHEARLYLGVNREDELCARSVLETLQHELPKLQVTLCVWRPGGGWSGFHGNAVEAMQRDLAALKEAGRSWPDLYLCGPTALIDAASRSAQQLGLPDAQIYGERFVPAWS